MFFDNPEIWINGGLSAVALALILLIGAMVKYFSSLISKHMESNDVVLRENAKAMTKMSASLDNNTNALLANNRILDRVERHLDK